MHVTTKAPRELGSEPRPRAFAEPTVCAAFQLTVSERPDQPALRMKDSDLELSYAQWNERVQRVAAGLHALGVRRGDAVGLLLSNRIEFFVCDGGAMHLGATCFSIYITASVEQAEYVVGDAGNAVIFTEQEHLDRVLAVRERVPALEHVIVVDGEAPEGVLSLDELEALGADAGDFDFEAAWRAVEPDDVLCLIYTSGTTGPPKGVELTHDNLMSVWRATYEVWPVGSGGRTVSFLPNAHIADRWGHLYAAPVFGHTIHCCPNPREMVAYSVEVRPTAWGGVPRIWEKLKAAMEAGFAAEQDEAKRQAVEWALGVGRRRVRLRQAGEAVPPELEEEYRKADELVLYKIRERLGLEQCQWFVVGAAPTPVDVMEFFAAIGIEISETWGMSETSAVTTINPPGSPRYGTVGPAVPGVELRLADDGEVLVRGPHVMRGYRNQPEKTSEAIDADGWLHTGDIGVLDDEGYLKIVDRKKELIINAAGKNMSPANIEAKIKSASPLIGQAVAIGDRRPYNVALVVLDPDGMGMFAHQNGIEDASPEAMAEHPKVLAEVEGAIERANADLSRVEQIKKFKLLPVEWQPGGEELTPTMKLKRKPIAEKYADEIEALYAG